MIKGAQKQMIVVRTGSSRYFDEAYFVLKRDLEKGTGGREDLLAEADRILRESEPRRRRTGVCKKRALGLLLLGAAFGAGVTLLIMFLL